MEHIYGRERAAELLRVLALPEMTGATREWPEMGGGDRSNSVLDNCHQVPRLEMNSIILEAELQRQRDKHKGKRHQRRPGSTSRGRWGQ